MTNNNILFQKHCPSFLSFKATELFLDADIKNIITDLELADFFCPEGSMRLQNDWFQYHVQRLSFVNHNIGLHYGILTAAKNSVDQRQRGTQIPSSRSQLTAGPVTIYLLKFLYDTTWIFYTHTQMIKHMNDFSGNDFNFFFP